MSLSHWKPEDVRKRMREQEENDVIYAVKGLRGRNLRVYPYKAVITTDVTVGSVLTSNATDGEKTIYFSDCIGVQLKKPGLAIGYLQFETAADTMNNQKSNFFNENSFTYGGDVENLVQEIYEYVIGILNDLKAPAYFDLGTIGSQSRFKMEKDLAEIELILKQDPDNRYAKQVIEEYSYLISESAARKKEREEAARERSINSSENQLSVEERRDMLERKIKGLKQQIEWEKKRDKIEAFEVQLKQAEEELKSL